MSKVCHCSGEFVEGAAFVVVAFEAVAVENLHLVDVVDEDAAVAALLAAGAGHERRAEFDVHFEVAEGLRRKLAGSVARRRVGRRCGRDGDGVFRGNARPA